MNSFTRNIVFLVAVIFATLSSSSGARYTTRFDNVDIDEIIKSDRLLSNYSKCLLDQGRCSPDGAELKRLLPDALQTSCISCSPKQRMGAMKLVAHLKAHKPELWRQISMKYDPRGLYSSKYGL